MVGTGITNNLRSILSGSASCCVSGNHSRTAVDLHTLSADALCTSSRANSAVVGGQLGCKGVVQMNKLNVGYWNMRTLVEGAGAINTALTSSTRREFCVDKKSELMVAELKRFEMNVTEISETNWFGQEIYHVQGFRILHSG